MNNTPQQVTQRYISNLLHYGRNKEFDLVEIYRKFAREPGPEAEVVGVYFQVLVHSSGPLVEQVACGATIAQAVRRALEKHGVTFR